MDWTYFFIISLLVLTCFAFGFTVGKDYGRIEKTREDAELELKRLMEDINKKEF